MICTCLTFKLAIFFQLTSNITASATHPTPATLAEDEITVYSLLTKSTRTPICDSNLSFQGSSLLFRPSSDSLTKAESLV